MTTTPSWFEVTADASGVSAMSLENPAISLNDPATWDGVLVGPPSASGMRVGVTDSLKVAAVWQAVSMISGDIASMKCSVYRSENKDNQPDWSHPAQPLVYDQANEYCTAYEFWRTLLCHALLWNNGYAIINRAGGRGANYRPTELVNLLPNRVEPRWYNGRLSYLVRVEEEPGRLVPYEAAYDDVIHVKGITLSNPLGVSLIEKARDTIGLAMAGVDFASKFFKNGGRIGGVLTVPAGMGKTARDRAEEGFRRTYEGGENPFKVFVARDGVEFKPGQMSPEQSQLVESRVEAIRSVAQLFNIPPSRLGLKDSVSYNSAEQDGIAYRTGCLNHWTTAITAELDTKCRRPTERASRSHYFEFDYKRLIYTDTKTLATIGDVLRRNEAISPNEFRRMLGFGNRPDGGGDTYDNPNTKTDSGQQERPEPEGDADDSPRPSARVKVAALVQADRNRAWRKIGANLARLANDPSQLLAWLDEPDTKGEEIVEQTIRDAVVALAEVSGRSEEAGFRQAQRQAAAMIDQAKALVRPYTEPPYGADSLAANVAHVVDTLKALNGAWPELETAA